MRAEWEPDELIDAWTLTGGDWGPIANKAGVTRLGFAVMLKFYEIEGRFPAYREEVPQAAVAYLGSLVKVEPALFAKYSWRGRTIEYHRAQIRRVYGTRPPTEADEDRWAQWLAEEICPTETNRDRLAAALRRRCRKGARRAKVPLAPATAAALDAYLADRARRGGLSDARQLAGPLLATASGGRLRQGHLWELVRRLARDAGIQAWDQLSPHCLRHSAITFALDAGATLRDVQDYAGHKDPRTTRRYDHARDSLDRNAAYAVAAYLA